MKTLLFTGSVVSADKEPLFCSEVIEASEKTVRFKNYPLSLLKTEVHCDGISIDGFKYEWHRLPVTINKTGKHVTVYRETVEENITVRVELKPAN